MSDHRIDELQIVVSAEVKEALDGIGKVQDKVEKLGSAKGTKNKQLENIVAESETASKKLGEVEKALDRTGEKSRVKVNVGEGTKQFEDMKKGLGGVADKAEQTAQQINKAFSFDDAKKLAGNLSQTEIAQQKLNNAIKEYQTMLNQGAGADKLAKQKLKVNQLQNSYDRLVQQQERNAERQAQAVEKEEQARIRAVEKELQYQEKLAQKKDLLLHKERMAELKSSKATYKDTARGYKGATKDYKSAEKYWKEVEKEGRKAEAVFRAVEKAQNDMMRNASVSPNMARNLVDTTSKADTLRMKLDEATETVRRLMVEGTGGSKLASAIENVKKAQSDLNTELRRPYLEQQEKRMATLKKIASGTATVMKKLGSATATVGRGIGKPLLTPFSQVSKAVRGVNAEVSRLFKNLKRVALYRALREMIRMVTEGIKTGVSNAYQWALAMEEAFGTGKESATRFRASMDSLATSSLYLKNSLGAMAMPLLNILAPAVDYMIDKFVALLNIINKLIATVSGASTWTRALKYPKAFGEALDDASGSAGKLKDELITILGIDEINPMADAKDPSGRGGGASGLADDYGAMFEEVALESDRLDDILSALFDPFKQAWESKGKGVMEAFDNALNGIKATAIAVGTSFWEVWTNGTGQQSIEHLLGILEGVLNTIGNIGEAFAKGWNTDNLGTRIVQNLWDALNSILDMWEKITKSISTWDFDFTGIFGGLEVLTRGIKEGIDAIGTSFSTVFSARAEGTFNTILGIFEGIERVLGNIALQFAKGWNTDNLGTKIFENLWDILDTILTTIKDIIDSTVEWSASVNFEPIISAFESLTRAVKPLIGLISDGLKWAWDNVLLPLGKWTIEAGLPSVISALAMAFDVLVLAVSKLAPLLKEVYDNLIKPSIRIELDIVTESWRKLTGIMTDLKDLLENGFSWNGILKPFKKLGDLFSSAVYAGQGLRKIFQGDFLGGLNDLTTAKMVLTEWGWSVGDAITESIESATLDPNVGAVLAGTNGFRLPVTADIEKVENKLPEDERKVDDMSAGIEDTYKGKGFKGVLDGLIAQFTGEPVKGSGFKSTITGLTGSVTGSLAKDSKFNPKVDRLNGSLTGKLSREGTFNPTIGGLSASITGTPTKEKGFKSTIGGMSAVFSTKNVDSKFNNRFDSIAHFVRRTKDDNKVPTIWSGWGIRFTSRDYDKTKMPAVWSGWGIRFISRDYDKNKMPTIWSGWGIKFTKRYIDFSTTVDAVAKIVDQVGTPTINANIRASKVLTANGQTLMLNADGGSYYSGSWHTIPQYASGGLPNHGSMFIAGEAGAELVGHIGGHTEVLNQSQMASALAEGMAPQAQLLQQLVAIGEQILAEQGDRNVVVSTSAITEGFQRMNRREGRTVVPVGV